MLAGCQAFGFRKSARSGPGTSGVPVVRRYVIWRGFSVPIGGGGLRVPQRVAIDPRSRVLIGCVMMIRWLVNFAKGFLSSWIRPLGVALAALLLLGIAGEVLLGVVPGIAPAAHDPSEIAQQIKAQSQLGRLVYAPHPELGALLAPSLHDAVETHDFSYTLRTDHAGFPRKRPMRSRHMPWDW
jgi:hypothetical protein